ncbi:putative Glutathione S-transferase 4 [Aphelenchoides fujianensis]|nr:putative Glutathione S-transferase 4 [Aphelenchoides fujianensis]
MVAYKLNYFNGRGIAEPARLLFAYAGIPFEDVRYELPDFPKETKRFGHAGRDDLEAAEIDAIGYVLKDFWSAYLPYLLVVVGRRTGDKASKKLREEHLLPALKTFGPLLERLLDESGNGFYHRSGISWVDFVAANFFLSAHSRMPEFGDLKKLVQHCERVHSLPQLKNYVANRTDTGF